MFDTDIFNYMNVLDKAADASWIRNEVISNNIANATTPEYKRQDVSFESTLSRALGNSKYETMDDKVANLKTNQLRAEVYTPGDSYSYRLDGNSVDIDAENTYLAENQIKYNALIQSIDGEFKSLQAVMK